MPICICKALASPFLLITMLVIAPGAFSQDYELAINNGRVIDPTSKLDAVRSIGIRAGKVAGISDRPLAGNQTIDAAGLVVAPGFIDLHSHSVMTLAGARMQAMDCVTTAQRRATSPEHAARILRGLAETGRPLSVSALQARAAVWRPCEGYAAMHLWRASADVEQTRTLPRSRLPTVFSS
jgi:hypothetical protein